MKFDPSINSYIIALNQDTKEEDLAIIGSFYYGKPTLLTSVKEGTLEFKYQLEKSRLRFFKMLTNLKRVNISNIEYIRNGTVSSLCTKDEPTYPLSYDVLGKYEQVPKVTNNCIVCSKTNSIWEIKL